ncbi:unnamed protein product [Vitrella brassicaformis CCMP3155]|uniref:HMG box domain-containing protein n=2 Tax=Vitrella brassicaformis TaxID=1169539 RepID=A0A0G4EQ97_VITBC|nr:unnamed protein product [Vitrella brassicaformis CCMP3155]|eukprot:CEL99621.1 unnamed protein product [Vitrella brassicaformis CCMP3155]
MDQKGCVRGGLAAGAANRERAVLRRDSEESAAAAGAHPAAPTPGQTSKYPFDLFLEDMLGKVDRKLTSSERTVFELNMMSWWKSMTYDDKRKWIIKYNRLNNQ